MGRRKKSSDIASIVVGPPKLDIMSNDWLHEEVPVDTEVPVEIMSFNISLPPEVIDKPIYADNSNTTQVEQPYFIGDRFVFNRHFEYKGKLVQPGAKYEVIEIKERGTKAKMRKLKGTGPAKIQVEFNAPFMFKF